MEFPLDPIKQKMLRDEALDRLKSVFHDFRRLTQRAENHFLYRIGRSAELKMRGALEALKWRDVFFKRYFDNTASEGKKKLEKERLADQM